MRASDEAVVIRDEAHASEMLLHMRKKAYDQAHRNLRYGGSLVHYVDASAKYIAALEADRARQKR